jgi:hypothetical protein
MNRQIARSDEHHGYGFRAIPARPIDVTIADEQEFQDAMERYRSTSGRSFPTWSEVLEVLHALGYAKRIWKPVGPWAEIGPPPADGDLSAPSCWYATVQTPITP